MHAVHNARINLLATAINDLALAFTIAGFVAPLTGVSFWVEDVSLFALTWIGMECAQLALGGLRQ